MDLCSYALKLPNSEFEVPDSNLGSFVENIMSLTTDKMTTHTQASNAKPTKHQPRAKNARWHGAFAT